MRTVLVTGSSTGFGRGIVEEMLARGWRVVATMRRSEDRPELRDLEPTWGDRLVRATFDVTSPEDRAAIVARVEALGGIDALVNNAGYGLFGALEDLTEEQLRDQFEVNFFGSALTTRALLPSIRARRGTVVFISSAFGFNGFPLTSAYCSSKWAMEGLAESLHYELAPHGVHVALVEPGAAKTGFGTSVVWGEGKSEAFADQTRGYHRLKQNLSLRSKDMSKTVGRRVADFCDGLSRRMRVRVGGDAWVSHLALSLVPERIRAPLYRFLYGRIFRGKA